jgi:hypothetical protein
VAGGNETIQKYKFDFSYEAKRRKKNDRSV